MTDLPAGTDAAAFEAAVAAAPDDRGLRLVYADWCDDHGYGTYAAALRWAVANNREPLFVHRTQLDFGKVPTWVWHEADWRIDDQPSHLSTKIWKWTEAEVKKLGSFADVREWPRARVGGDTLKAVWPTPFASDDIAWFPSRPLAILYLGRALEAT